MSWHIWMAKRSSQSEVKLASFYKQIADTRKLMKVMRASSAVLPFLIL